jgi:hypothetical protein
LKPQITLHQHGVKSKLITNPERINEEGQMRQYRDFNDLLMESLRDPEDARIFLSIILEEYEEDGDTEAFLLALCDVIEAQCRITRKD